MLGIMSFFRKIFRIQPAKNLVKGLFWDKNKNVGIQGPGSDPFEFGL